MLWPGAGWGDSGAVGGPSRTRKNPPGFYAGGFLVPRTDYSLRMPHKHSSRNRRMSPLAWHGVAWRGMAWRGVAWRGVAWRGGNRTGPWSCERSLATLRPHSVAQRAACNDSSSPLVMGTATLSYHMQASFYEGPLDGLTTEIPQSPESHVCLTAAEDRHKSGLIRAHLYRHVGDGTYAYDRIQYIDMAINRFVATIRY